MTPDISILIPHKRDMQNNKALKVAVACIADNTSCNYEIIIDAETPADPYVLLNRMAESARSKWIFFSNSDIFVAPKWDNRLLELSCPGRMITVTLVEPGAIGVHSQNITANFGMTPDTFRRQDFEEFTLSNPVPNLGIGFEYYCLISRQDFIDFGKFDLSRGEYPEPLDSYFRDKWISNGNTVVRTNSYMYHLQNWSNPNEQIKEVRRG